MLCSFEWRAWRWLERATRLGRHGRAEILSRPPAPLIEAAGDEATAWNYALNIRWDSARSAAPPSAR